MKLQGLICGAKHTSSNDTFSRTSDEFVGLRK